MFATIFNIILKGQNKYKTTYTAFTLMTRSAL